MDDYISKPAKIEAIQEVLAKWIKEPVSSIVSD